MMKVVVEENIYMAVEDIQKRLSLWTQTSFAMLEYSDFKNIEFDSFIINNNKLNRFRLLDVDNHLILPYKLYIRGLVSSVDVIHSWAIPTIGLKVDAIPGRINQFLLYINFIGTYFGQCSEICGLNHRFIPIVLERVHFYSFVNWLKIY